MGDDAYSDDYRNELQELFAKYDGRLVSPGGAAALLGVSRKTIHTLGERGRLTLFRGPEEKHWSGPRWVYIPLDEVAKYAEEVGRPFPKKLR